ncbi:MAG: DNA-processing protein DprA [bacterium]
MLFVQGNQKILNSSTAAVLNSRKVRAVTLAARWLQVTIKLTKQAIEKNLTIVSSLGMLTYEIVTFIAHRCNSKIIIVLDGYLPGVLSPDVQKAFYDKFSNMFDLNNTLFISPFWPELTLPVRRQRLTTRDYWVVALAKYLFVVEAKAEGNIQKLASESLSQGRKVTVFQPIKFDHNTKGNETLLLAGAEVQEVTCTQDSLEGAKLKPDVEKTPLQQPLVELSEYLFHYTRACPGPWPGQSLSEYIQSLVSGELDAKHTAFDTLCRILKEQLIRASNRLVRVKTPVVSFTACLPDELGKIRKWNPALIRWTFEPYAIGIRKGILKEMKAQPVIYASEDKFRQLPESEQFRFQIHQPPKTDWSLEKEWRVPGDVILSHISAQDIVIIVSTPQEAAIIHKEFQPGRLNVYSTPLQIAILETVHFSVKACS